MSDLKSKFSEPFKLDLGCGFYKPEGYIGLDNGVGFPAQRVDEKNGPDIIMDLNVEPLPFPNSSCMEVRGFHFIEHCVLDHIFNEAYRVLKPDGVLRMIIPYANSAEGLFPGHRIFLTEKWFKRNLNFCNKFEIVGEIYKPSEDYKRLPFFIKGIIPFRFARTFFFNACHEMHLTCKVRK